MQLSTHNWNTLMRVAVAQGLDPSRLNRTKSNQESRIWWADDPSMVFLIQASRSYPFWLRYFPDRSGIFYSQAETSWDNVVSHFADWAAQVQLNSTAPDLWVAFEEVPHQLAYREELEREGSLSEGEIEVVEQFFTELPTLLAQRLDEIARAQEQTNEALWGGLVSLAEGQFQLRQDALAAIEEVRDEVLDVARRSRRGAVRLALMGAIAQVVLRLGLTRDAVVWLWAHLASALGALFS